MALTPAGLRASAEKLRRSASFVTTAFESVPVRGGSETWEGPAATTFREGAAWAERLVADVAVGFRAAAVRLEARADALQREIDAAEREVERRRVELAECRRREAENADRRRRHLPVFDPQPCRGSHDLQILPPEPLPLLESSLLMRDDPSPGGR